jgi:hypothetical protein
MKRSTHEVCYFIRTVKDHYVDTHTTLMHREGWAGTFGWIEDEKLNAFQTEYPELKDCCKGPALGE